MTMAFQKKVKTKSGTYVIEVQGYRDENGKVKHKYLKYLGKLDEEGNLIPSMKIENVEVEHVTLSGPVCVLHSITKDMGLEPILGEYAPEVLTLVYSHVVRPESLNNIKRAIQWIDTDEIGLELPVSRKRFERAMDVLAKNIPTVERLLYQRIKDVCNLETIFYDVTGIYFNGRNVTMAKRGHNSDLPQVGIGLATESEYGLPLFHHVFDGNVFDAKTFPVILARLQEFARDHCTLIFDRGIASKKNVSDALDSGFSVIASLPLKGKKLKQLALSTVKDMTPGDICELSSVFVHAKEVARGWAGLDVRVIVCVNKPLRQQIQQNRYYELKEALEKIKNGSKVKRGIKKYIKNINGVPEIDYQAVEEGEKYDGIFIIITDTDIPIEKVIQKYFERDVIEKSFYFLKSIVSIQPVRHWLQRRVRAHIFICYLAYLHLSWMKMLLMTHGISMSPVKALQELETIYNVNLTDKKTGMSTTRTVPLTEKQKKIYRALNLLS